jgi:hypothetical protein
MSRTTSADNTDFMSRLKTAIASPPIDPFPSCD